MPCLHHWSKWEDTKVADEFKVPHGWPYPMVRQVIVQQRRCKHCNKVLTRRA